MPASELHLPERGFLPAPGPTRPTLRHLFALIAHAKNVEALRAALVPAAVRHFGAARAALMLFDEAVWLQSQPEVRDNPVVRYLFERHTAVHEGVVVAPGEWSALCPWIDHGHVLAGPIVREGELNGALALTRSQEQAAFDARDLEDASALCGHLCAWFALQSRTEPLGTIVLTSVLTPREREITELVAQGLTNAQIGARLCVSGETVKAALKLLFRKTGVKSRAQLVARRRI